VTNASCLELGASTRDLTPLPPLTMSLPVVNLGINYGNDKGRSLQRSTTENLVLNSPTELITSFLSTFKGKAEEVTAGLADIHLDDTLPSETVGLKYMRQLVCRG